MLEVKRGNNRLYIGDSEDKPLAVMTFVPKGNQLYVVDHTYVSEELRGKGIAKLLLRKMVAMVRKEGKKIIPVCSYVKKQLEQNQEYYDVLERGI